MLGAHIEQLSQVMKQCHNLCIYILRSIDTTKEIFAYIKEKNA